MISIAIQMKVRIPVAIVVIMDQELLLQDRVTMIITVIPENIHQAVVTVMMETMVGVRIITIHQVVIL